MKKIKLPTRIGNLILSLTGDFDNVVRLGRTGYWVVKSNYLVMLGTMGVSSLLRYRSVGIKTMRLVTQTCAKQKNS